MFGREGMISAMFSIALLGIIVLVSGVYQKGYQVTDGRIFNEASGRLPGQQ